MTPPRSAARRLALAAGLAAAACNRDPYGMLRQPRPRPYQGSPVFADGRSMRTPPAGTVPRGTRDFAAPVATGVAGGRDLDRVPVPVTEDLLRRGRRDYDVWCAVCHGTLGDGQSVPAEKMALRRPPSLIDPALPPGRIYRAIALGYGLMPPYAEQLPVPERWGVVAYVQALRRSRRASIGDAPPAVRRALERAP